VPSWSAETARMVVVSDPNGSPAESFRQLRTNLQFLRIPGDLGGGYKGAHVVAVTSSVSDEGKSTVAANLAQALAETGARVLLLDADLRRPTVADIMHIEGSVGLTTVLVDQAVVADVVQEWGTAGLHVLPSGSVPPNPAELLGSPAMRRLMADLRSDYDYVLLDTAPVLPVADASVLSALVDGMVVVARAGRVRRRQLAQTQQDLGQVSATVLGVVLNGVRREEETYSYRGDRAAPVAVTSESPAARVGGGRVR
jgi:succinoglycan biosynthesis transport protein ExoP